MTAHLPTRRPLAAVVALACALGVLLMGLLASPRALAQSHGTSCTRPPTAHSKHPARTCRQTTRKVKVKAKAKPPVRHASKRTPRGHTRGRALAKSAPAGSASLIPASCEDGSEPVRQADGSRACADGSEASCEDGSTPIRPRTGTILLCPIPTAPAAGASECEDGTATPCSSGSEAPAELTVPGCEDGSAPIPAGIGTYSCGAEVAPRCLEGSSPTFSSDGLDFVCEREG